MSKRKTLFEDECQIPKKEMRYEHFKFPTSWEFELKPLFHQIVLLESNVQYVELIGVT